jgi:hypothetical protein
MGLDIRLVRIDYDGPRASWSYSGFMTFRRRLAREIGIDLEEMAGFKTVDPPGSIKDPGISWETVTDAIEPLLNHSDCDGDLGYDECGRVAPRLREIVAFWPDDYDKQQALYLVEMMEEVAEGDAERVVFQ